MWRGDARSVSNRKADGPDRATDRRPHPPAPAFHRPGTPRRVTGRSESPGRAAFSRVVVPRSRERMSGSLRVDPRVRRIRSDTVLRSSHRPVEGAGVRHRRTVCVSLRPREETGDTLVPTEIRLLRAEDAATLANVASGVFDDALDQAATPEFLRDPRHHLAVAVDADVVVGFASAVHYVHPDKPSPELWINEIGVAATHRGLGVGRALLEALLDVARQLGCVEAWVLTDRGNEPAMRLYKSGGGVAAAGDHVMFTFRL
jgi:GNAT superfamily N-acetyltransferase